MNFLICSLLSIFMIFLNDVQSMDQKQPLPRSQQPRGDAVEITYRNGIWYLDKQPYGEEHQATILPFLPPRPPLDDLMPRNQLRKLQKELNKLARRPLLIPQIYEGDVIYRRGKPIGRVNKYRQPQEFDPSDPNHLHAHFPMDGDTIILNGPRNQWFTLLNGSRVQGPQTNPASPGASPLIN